MWGKIIGGLVKPIFGVIDKSIADKDLALKLKAEMQQLLLVDQAKTLEAQANIIIAEAQGDSWLQQSWRPITMLFFVGLVGAHWMGFTPDNISENEVLSLLEIVKIGLGGYVVGRTVEKTAKSLSLKNIL